MSDWLKELQARREHALGMGGEERISKQHGRGKKTVRERIDLLCDQGSFQEYGLLASHQGEHGVAQDVNEVTPSDGVVFGIGDIDGRLACVVGEDFTVKGGTYGQIHGLKKRRALELALKDHIPIVWVLDGAGARAQEMIGEGLPYGVNYLMMAKLSGIAPQVGVVMGPSAGDSSLIASSCEFVIMVEGTSMLAAGGPPIVKAATGQDISKEELGGSSIHCRVSGVADNAVATEAEAIALTKRYLSYLPGNAWEYPPQAATDDPVERVSNDLLDIVPDDSRRPYDMHDIINRVFDLDSFLEIKPQHAQSIITGFARMDGHPVGIVANQPTVAAGSITTQAARKARHFIDLCSAYHVPLVFLQDVPGVMPGPESEREGALRAGLSLAYALAWADVPTITVIIRKSFGYGACAMAGGGSGQSVVLAWPGADFGSLPPSSAVLAAHGKELEAAEDPDALRDQLMDNYKQCSGAFHAARTFSVDDVVDPRETRLRVAKALQLARRRRTQAAQPTPRFGVMP